MVRIDDHGRARLITFDRPEALNAMNSALYTASAEALDEAATDPNVATVVLTGAGRAYCAGQDLNEMGAPPEGEHGFQRFADTITAFPKPLIAAVNGLAIGIGFTMLPYCDLVLVADTARFRTPFAQLGVVPEAASSFLFPATMGWQEAAYTLLTGEWRSASDVVAAGLALREVPADQLLDEALALAAKLAVLPVPSLVETKRLMRAQRDAAAREARAQEEATFAELLDGPACREALTAFAEKREPDFTNLPLN